jgi:hypothetical protein
MAKDDKQALHEAVLEEIRAVVYERKRRHQALSAASAKSL